MLGHDKIQSLSITPLQPNHLIGVNHVLIHASKDATSIKYIEFVSFLCKRAIIQRNCRQGLDSLKLYRNCGDTKGD